MISQNSLNAVRQEIRGINRALDMKWMSLRACIRASMEHIFALLQLKPGVDDIAYLRVHTVGQDDLHLLQKSADVHVGDLCLALGVPFKPFKGHENPRASLSPRLKVLYPGNHLLFDSPEAMEKRLNTWVYLGQNHPSGRNFIYFFERVHQKDLDSDSERFIGALAIRHEVQDPAEFCDVLNSLGVGALFQRIFSERHGEIRQQFNEQYRSTKTLALNMPAFYETLQEVLNQLNRKVAPSSTLWAGLLDLDLFGEINHKFGIDRGDKILALLAEAFRKEGCSFDSQSDDVSSFPKKCMHRLFQLSDECFILLYHLHGDEFAILAAGDLRAVMGRLERIFRNFTNADGYGDIMQTLSLGMVQISGNLDVLAIKRLANRALERVKAFGPEEVSHPLRLWRWSWANQHLERRHLDAVSKAYKAAKAQRTIRVNGMCFIHGGILYPPSDKATSQENAQFLVDNIVWPERQGAAGKAEVTVYKGRIS